jgi:uncharacterized protein
MNRSIGRRKFLQQIGAGVIGGMAMRDALSAEDSVTQPTSWPVPGSGNSQKTRVDVHCHVGLRARPCQEHDRFTFEPALIYSHYDAYVSDRLYCGLGGAVARWYFGVGRKWNEQRADTHIEARMLEHLLGASSVDRAVVLAFDQYHGNDGTCIGVKGRGERFGSDLYVSNTYVRELCRQHPERLLFGASIHPYRQSSTSMLQEVADAGAVLVKWLPVAQNIDAEDQRAVAFLRKAGEIAMPMLIHYGGEMTLGTAHPSFQDPSGLLRVLRLLRAEGTMPTVIVAHAATPSLWPFGTTRYFEMMLDAMRGEFADAPLYVDMSALASISRAHWLKRLAKLPEIHNKLVYGSDYPIPPSIGSFRAQLGKQYRKIAAIANPIDKDVAIKAALGFGEDVFARGGELLRMRIRGTLST